MWIPSGTREVPLDPLLEMGVRSPSSLTSPLPCYPFLSPSSTPLPSPSRPSCPAPSRTSADTSSARIRSFSLASQRCSS